MINYYWVSIKGKNIKYFLNTLFKQKIKIESIKYHKDEILVKVSYEEYKRILKIKTSCSINIVKTSGSKRIWQLYQKYKISLVIFVISVFFIIIMSHLVLYINIESDNKELSNLVKKELFNNNITLYSYRKSHNKLDEISSKIKNNNLDKIEWIEIEQKGVFLNIRIIPRVNKQIKNSNKYQDIVAAKDGYIRKIVSKNGQLLKNIDDYVKKGEVIISGNIFRNEKPVGQTRATGKVYAEVWYLSKINKNIYHNTMIKKDKGKTGMSLNINNKEVELIYLPSKVIVPKKVTLFQNRTFSLTFNKKQSLYLKKQKYNQKELQNILELKAKQDVLKKLKKDEYIISQKTLKKVIKNDKMYIEVFFKCYEDIAEVKDIQKIEEKKDD